MAPNSVTQFIIDFTAGAIGGSACVFSGQAFDTTKVKMQTFPTMYRSFFHCFTSTYRHGGVRGLYKGTTPALISQISENAVLFLGYGLCQDAFRLLCGLDKGKKLSDLQMAASGSLSGIFSSLATCPPELVKCRLQVMREVEASGRIVVEQKSTAWMVVRNIMRTSGPLGFYRGLTATFMREIPGYFCLFGAYELCRSTFARHMGTDKDGIGVPLLMFSGGFAGGCFWLSVFPVDSVKSRIQVHSLAGRQQGFMKTFLGVLRTEGFLALYSGLSSTMIRTFPANGALFLAYEWSRKFMMEKVGA